MDRPDGRIKADHITIDIDPPARQPSETNQTLKLIQVASLPQTIQGWMLVIFFGLELVAKTVGVAQSFGVISSTTNTTLPR